MNAICQQCGTSSAASGTCPSCHGVALYDAPWPGPDLAASPPTPLVESRTPGLEGVLLKVEGANPSGSFKDRVMVQLVREAVGRRATGAVVASSGNAAIAAASACARVGMPLLVLVPTKVSPSAVRMAELRGATIVVAGEGPAAVHGLAKRLATRFELTNLASTFAAPGCEFACRAIGHEIAFQAPELHVGSLAASISVGPVLIGAANGLVEQGASLPRLIGAQAAGCAPIAEAFRSGHSAVTPWEGPADTAALAIADRLTGYADEATFALGRIRDSGGHVAAFMDDEMQRMRQELARYDGLDVELASCAAALAVRDAPRAEEGRTVCILTGSGVKETLADLGPVTQESTTDAYAAASGAGNALVEEVEAWKAGSLS